MKKIEKELELHKKVFIFSPPIKTDLELEDLFPEQNIWVMLDEDIEGPLVWTNQWVHLYITSINRDNGTLNFAANYHEIVAISFKFYKDHGAISLEKPEVI